MHEDTTSHDQLVLTDLSHGVLKTTDVTIDIEQAAPRDDGPSQVEDRDLSLHSCA